MNGVETIGHFFFRTRNVLFPIILVAVLALWPPVPLASVGAVVLMVVGCLLVISGQALRVGTIGLDYIRRGGKNGRVYADRLVTGGLFAHSRNPMYVGNVAIAAGFFFIAGDPIAVCVGTLGSYGVYFAIIRGEEAYLARWFGDAYLAYCRDVPRWLPNPRELARTLRSFRFDWAAVVVREYGTLFTNASIVLAIIAVKAARGGHLSANAGWYIAIGVGLTLLYSVARYLKKSRRLRAARR